MKKDVRIILFVLLIIVIIFIIYFLMLKEKNQDLKDNKILFEKHESWGPCSPPPNNICYQTTKLYYLGELITEGNKNITKQLDKETMNKIINQIKISEIMDKNCTGRVVLDYYVIYKIFLDNKNKTIIYPGCEEELKEIEKLIPFNTLSKD